MREEPTSADGRVPRCAATSVRASANNSSQRSTGQSRRTHSSCTAVELRTQIILPVSRFLLSSATTQTLNPLGCWSLEGPVQLYSLCPVAVRCRTERSSNRFTIVYSPPHPGHTEAAQQLYPVASLSVCALDSRPACAYHTPISVSISWWRGGQNEPQPSPQAVNAPARPPRRGYPALEASKSLTLVQSLNNIIYLIRARGSRLRRRARESACSPVGSSWCSLTLSLLSLARLESRAPTESETDARPIACGLHASARWAPRGPTAPHAHTTPADGRPRPLFPFAHDHDIH